MHWNVQAQKCEPDVCSGSNLLEIPGYDGFTTTDIVEGSTIYDTNIVRQCFTNKYVVLLGDSSVEELMHDLVVLLNRLGNDNKLLGTYFRCAAWHSSGDECFHIDDEATKSKMSITHHKDFKRFMLEGNSILELDKSSGHRNMTYEMPDFGILIR